MQCACCINLREVHVTRLIGEDYVFLISGDSCLPSVGTMLISTLGG